jgi:hypothetical protein
LPTSYAPPQRAEKPTAEVMRDGQGIAAEAGKGQNSVITWTDDAKALAEKIVKRVPFFVRVSVTKKMRAEVEKLARERDGTVDVAIVEEVFAAFRPRS